MKRLKELRQKFGLTQSELAAKISSTKSSISHWEKGDWEPDYETLIKLANILNCSTDYLIENDSNSNVHNNKCTIPVLGKIPAGIPIEMIDDIIDYEDISPNMLIGNKTYFALKIKGDSMGPKFLENDILIVRKQDDCNSGDYAIISINGFDATFKKVIKKESGIILQPLNPNYEPMMYSNAEIESLPVKILGVVVEIRRSL